MTLVDPCPTTKLTINVPVQFITETYYLRDPQINRAWDIDIILSKDTAVDCSNLIVKFLNIDESTPDPIFVDNRTIAGEFNFATTYTEDITKKGTY